MTIRERLQIVGQALTGSLPTKEIVREVKVKDKEKSILGGFVDLFGNNSLSTETRISSKLLEANTSWVYKNNDVIAKEVGQIEFKLYTVRIVKQDIVLNPILQHPLLDALDRFNEFTAASDGFYTTQSHRKLTGDAFWYLEGNGRNINAIYLLSPDKVELKLGDVTGGQRIIQAYEFKDTVQGKTITQTYDPEDIIHFKVPNPKNPYRGLGAVEAAADSIDTDNLAIEAQKGLYERGLITNIVLTTPNRISPEQLQQLRAEWLANYTGSKNAFRVPILSGDLKPQSIQMTNREMEFIAQQTWLRDKIMSIFGNNRAVLGITDDVNRSNAESTILQWKRSTVKPEMKGITDTLNEFLVPRYGSNLLLTFEDPVEEDESGDIENVQKLVEANVITQNEARERLGYDPIKDENADSLRQPSTFSSPIVDIPKPVKNVDYMRVFRRMGVIKQLEQRKALKEAAKPMIRHLVKATEPEPVKVNSTRPSRFSDEVISRYYEKQLSLVETQEKVFHDKVERFINRLVEKAIANVPEEVTQMQQKQLLNEEDEIVQATLDFMPILTELAASAGNIALDLIDYDKPYIPTDIREEIRRRVEMFAQSMVETDKAKLIDIIAQGVENGESIPSIRQSIVDTFSEYSKMQAQRITRTEVLRVSNRAAIDAWEQSGVVEGKQWLTAPGADAECEIYDGEVVSLSRNFYAPEGFADGDPPIHPNCRCTVIPVLLNEKSFDTEEIAKRQLKDKIVELEAKIDKRTKEFRKLKEKELETQEYVNELENLLNGSTETNSV